MTEHEKLDFEIGGFFSAHTDANFLIVAHKLKEACQAIDAIKEVHSQNIEHQAKEIGVIIAIVKKLQKRKNKDCAHTFLFDNECVSCGYLRE